MDVCRGAEGSWSIFNVADDPTHSIALHVCDALWGVLKGYLLLLPCLAMFEGFRQAISSAILNDTKILNIKF
jgi:hypothetical protein